LARPTAGAKPYKGLFDFAASDPPDEKKRKTAPEAVVWYGSNNPKKRKNYTDFPFMPANKISSSQNFAATHCGRKKPLAKGASGPPVGGLEGLVSVNFFET
jgi:hypothetical protein